MSFSVWQNHICLIKQLVAQCFCCCFVAAKYNFVTQYLQKLVFLSDCTTTSTLQIEAIIRIVLDFQIYIALCLILVSFIQHLFNLYFSLVQVQKNQAVIFLNKIHPFKNRVYTANMAIQNIANGMSYLCSILSAFQHPW